jgi:hypothetical protein
MLVYINDIIVKDKIKEDFGFEVPLYSVVDTIDGKYNSPLWFEMYRPDEAVCSDYISEKTLNLK